MITAWRLAAPEFGSTPEQMMSGKGAYEYGGRWNSPGVAAVYVGGSLALASMELLVHLSRAEVLRSFLKMPVFFPEAWVMRVDTPDLPDNWHAPVLNPPTQRLGTEWLLSGESAVLQVPSAIVLEEDNFLLNPVHPDFAKIEVGEVTEYQLDSRLLG